MLVPGQSVPVTGSVGSNVTLPVGEFLDFAKQVRILTETTGQEYVL